MSKYTTGADSTKASRQRSRRWCLLLFQFVACSFLLGGSTCTALVGSVRNSRRCRGHQSSPPNTVRLVIFRIPPRTRQRRLLALLASSPTTEQEQHQLSPTTTTTTTTATATASSSSSYLDSFAAASTHTPNAQAAMDAVLEHPSVAVLELDRRPRRKLKPRHGALFCTATGSGSSSSGSSGSSSSTGSSTGTGTETAPNETKNNLVLFETLARICCESGVVPRKEFFETYAAAVCIHDEEADKYRCDATNNGNSNDNGNEIGGSRFGCGRIADLAAGHGLLSWMLLALDHYEVDSNASESDSESDSDSNDDDSDPSFSAPVGLRLRIPRPGDRPLRTAVCVDRRMPPSALAIAESMRKHLFPTTSTYNSRGGGEGEDDDDDEQHGDDDSVLYDRTWTYVECDLRNVVVSDASTLLVSVHACGTLTDALIGMGIGSSSSNGSSGSGSTAAPLAIVPCCHTYSIRKGYAPHPEYSGTTAEAVGATIVKAQRELDADASGVEALTTTTTADNKNKTPIIDSARHGQSKANPKFRIVEDVIDGVRVRTLVNAGYDSVRIASLPPQFTERNRLVLAHRGGDSSSNSSSKISSKGADAKAADEQPSPDPSSRSLVRKGSMPPRAAKQLSDATTATATTTATTEASCAHPDFVVPLADDPESIDACVAVSGKARAAERLRALLSKYFSPKLDVSFWLTPDRGDDATAISTGTATAEAVDFEATLSALRDVLDETVEEYQQQQQQQQSRQDSNSNKTSPLPLVSCSIRPLPTGRFVHPLSGRVSCTYQIEYSRSGSVPFPKATAKLMHERFSASAVRSIDGIELRDR